MNEIGRTYDLLVQLTQKSQFGASRGPALAAVKLDAHERQRRQVERDILNVRSMLDAAGRFQKIMDEVIASFERDRPEREAA